MIPESQPMSDEEYNRRQQEAFWRLREIGIHRVAQVWIRSNRPPDDWEGTPLEFAEKNMCRNPYYIIFFCIAKRIRFPIRSPR